MDIRTESAEPGNLYHLALGKRFRGGRVVFLDVGKPLQGFFMLGSIIITAYGALIVLQKSRSKIGGVIIYD